MKLGETRIQRINYNVSRGACVRCAATCCHRLATCAAGVWGRRERLERVPPTRAAITTEVSAEHSMLRSASQRPPPLRAQHVDDQAVFGRGCWQRAWAPGGKVRRSLTVRYSPRRRKQPRRSRDHLPLPLLQTTADSLAPATHPSRPSRWRSGSPRSHPEARRTSEMTRN